MVFAWFCLSFVWETFGKPHEMPSRRQQCEKRIHAKTSSWSKLRCFNVKIYMFEFGESSMMISCMSYDDIETIILKCILFGNFHLWLCSVCHKVLSAWEDKPANDKETKRLPTSLLDFSHTAFNVICMSCLMVYVTFHFRQSHRGEHGGCWWLDPSWYQDICVANDCVGWVSRLRDTPA